MLCPYNRKSEKCIKRNENNLINEEMGIIKSNLESYVVTFELMECPEEGCGAWQNNKCNYNSTIA